MAVLTTSRKKPSVTMRNRERQHDRDRTHDGVDDTEQQAREDSVSRVVDANSGDPASRDPEPDRA